MTELPLEAYDQIYKAASNPGKELVPLFASQGMKLQVIENFQFRTERRSPLHAGTRQLRQVDGAHLFGYSGTAWLGVAMALAGILGLVLLEKRRLAAVDPA